MTIPDESSLQSWHFRELRWSLQALASAASDQLKLFPELAANADQLALDFDHWASVVRADYGGELSASQTDALAAIDRKLATISRDGAEFDPELWTESGLGASAHWEDVRRLAASALAAFGWPVESPPQPRGGPGPHGSTSIDRDSG
jgi:hypothetical protein